VSIDIPIIDSVFNKTVLRHKLQKFCYIFQLYSIDFQRIELTDKMEMAKREIELLRG